MCNPLSCCCQPPSRTATQVLGVDPVQAQGLDDFLKNLCGSICGCADKKRRAKLEAAVMLSAQNAWPQANPDCLGPAVTAMVNALGKSIGVLFTGGPAQFVSTLVTEMAVPLSDFIGCVFGQQPQQRFNIYSGAAVPLASASMALPPQLLQCLLSLAMNLLCGGAKGGGAVTGSLCTPPGPAQPVQPTPPAPTNPGCACCPPTNPTQPPPSQGDWKPATEKRC